MKKREFIQILGAGAASLALTPLAVSSAGCSTVTSSYKNRKLKFWSDIHPNESPMNTQKSDEEWKWLFSNLKRWGIAGVIVLCRTNKIVDQLVRITEEVDIKLLTWIISLEYPDTETMKNHPDWYVVNGNGESCIDKPPYISDYRWLCPSNPEVHEFMVTRVKNLAGYQGVSGVHLDYIRYPDVFLQPNIRIKYNIPQDEVTRPEYDFCYCPVCRKKFTEKYGTDPLKLTDPATSADWLQFRCDSISDLVNELYETAHAKGKTLTASVFSTPSKARAMVRQDWPSWKLDFVMAMMYNYYEKEPIEWIGKATAEGVKALNGKMPLYSVLHLLHLTPEEIAQAAKIAIDAGASGIDFFTGNGFTDFQWKCLKDTGIM
jgi:uncharacterized lipoprotein YddW (UPF0748 family)